MADDLTRRIEEEAQEDLSALSRILAASRYPDSAPQPGQSGYPDSFRTNDVPDYPYMCQGLVELGYGEEEAEERLAEVLERVSREGGSLAVENVLKEALRSRRRAATTSPLPTRRRPC